MWVVPNNPVHMLLDPAVGTTRWSVQVLPLDLVTGHVQSRDVAVPRASRFPNHMMLRCQGMQNTAVSIGLGANTYIRKELF
ncbi:hypothetical protein Acr_11g0003400 [Actinidia rufa]|uniref:Uncharacterized protein n=1 Tax=Actinidia rufa TaxID=165716 RepID=A0A7J0FBC0_9ERIC|nr:hypothetical protein Acr_11g0003400 [Actinidia rufa]